MENLTISQIKKEKRKLESLVFKQLIEFEKKTNVQISSVNIERCHSIGLRGELISFSCVSEI